MLALIFKNKVDVQSCRNHRGIQLMKLWEGGVTISEQQCGVVLREIHVYEWEGGRCD